MKNLTYWYSVDGGKSWESVPKEAPQKRLAPDELSGLASTGHIRIKDAHGRDVEYKRSKTAF